MPHVDELLGPATFAAAGLFVAIAIQPHAPAAAAPQQPAAVAAPAGAAAAPVALPTIEVVARRSDALRADVRRGAKPQA
jgi:hypothetical protein